MFRHNMDIEDLIEAHRDVGDEKLGDVFEYLVNHQEEWERGDIRPEDIPHFDYDTALYIMNCVIFGTKWESEEPSDGTIRNVKENY